MNDVLAQLHEYGYLPFGYGMLDFTDEKYKDKQVMYQCRYMLNRTNEMFEYENLPETIPCRLLEQYLQTCGNVCITKVDDKLYAFFGGLGGEPDPYYQPTLYTVSNPALNFSKNLKIGEECVWGRSDSYGVGLMPLFQWYASMIVENGLTMRVALINSRITRPISAQDDNTYKSALKYLDDIEQGKLGVISEDTFFEGLNINNSSINSSEKMTDLIEFMQYLKASWYNDLGLNANYNMKRERIQNSEAELNNDALIPLVDNMLKARKQMVDEVNKMYGTKIIVKLSSAWEREQELYFEDENEDEEIENDSDENPIIDGSKEDSMDSDEESQENNEGNPENDEEIQIDLNVDISAHAENDKEEMRGGEDNEDNTSERSVENPD